MSSTAPPTPVVPPARRAVRPGWRDPRIVLGVLIVALSVLGGAALLGTGDETVTVWTAAEDLPAGLRLSSDDLRQRTVHFTDGSAPALYATGPAPAGRVLSRPVGAGELVPRAALAGAEKHLVEVPLRVDVEDVPATVQPGSRVDVWVAPRDAAVADRPHARRVLSDVLVVRLPAAGTSLAPESARQVVVAVSPTTSLDDALGAISAGRVLVTRRG
ncbi:MAG TPA: hypothetical protein VFL69_05935 [Marmoricola sp.]|nr:hypothetical protein [Marmoricola sp.]